VTEVFKVLESLLRLHTRKEKPTQTNTLEILKASYEDLSRLAQQINNHAEKAPYPHIAKQLRMIVEEKYLSAGLLKKEILKSGSQAEESKSDVKSGNNNWERITRDLEDQRKLESQLLRYAAILAEEAPEISELLKRIVAEQAPHRTSLLDIVARADPQANLSGL
jgi:hypothetical protein